VSVGAADLTPFFGPLAPAFTMTVYQHVVPGMQRQAVQLVADQKTKAARHLKVVGA
jgi:hypothetical protein